MTRKTYVYDPEVGKMVEGRSPPRVGWNGIMGDLPDFVSPIDGKVVNGRAGLREHNRQHDVTNPSDFKETWAKAAKERETIATGQNDKRARREAIERALYQKGVR